MCYHINFSKSKRQLEDRFKAEVLHGQLNIFFDNILPEYNGFSHPIMPIITNDNPAIIQPAEWGLLPSWAADRKFNNNTLNAKIETLKEKPSFKPYTSQRCLVPASGFYEWRWLDEKGKYKQKYFISITGEELFSFAGLYSKWLDPVTREEINTFTIITTEARGVMQYVHNSKNRMPMVLTPGVEEKWLKNGDIELLTDYLIAVPIKENTTELTLF